MSESRSAIPAPNWFVALPVPEGSAWAQASGLPDLPEGMRRLAAADLHLTLAFLGGCGEERARAAWTALASLRHPPALARAGAWRALGSPQRPSAWGLTLAEGRQAVADLIDRGRPLALEAAGCAPERREPLPHVTLLRPGRRDAPGHRAWMAERLARLPLPPLPARLARLALYTAAPPGTEQRYRIVVHRSLEAPSP